MEILILATFSYQSCAVLRSRSRRRLLCPPTPPSPVVITIFRVPLHEARSSFPDHRLPYVAPSSLSIVSIHRTSLLSPLPHASLSETRLLWQLPPTPAQLLPKIPSKCFPTFFLLHAITHVHIQHQHILSLTFHNLILHCIVHCSILNASLHIFPHHFHRAHEAATISHR